jgi:hypothetical protein
VSVAVCREENYARAIFERCMFEKEVSIPLLDRKPEVNPFNLLVSILFSGMSLPATNSLE